MSAASLESILREVVGGRPLVIRGGLAPPAGASVLSTGPADAVVARVDAANGLAEAVSSAVAEARPGAVIALVVPGQGRARRWLSAVGIGRGFRVELEALCEELLFARVGRVHGTSLESGAVVAWGFVADA